MTGDNPDRQMRTLDDIISDYGVLPAAQWPNPQIPTAISAEEAQRRAGLLLGRALTPEEQERGGQHMTDLRRATDDVQTAQREARESALHEAVMLHGEFESQECFRTEEVDKVLVTARRFYEYIWEDK